ncbi:MAG: hypothetical protein EZS28_004288 [Streblomastix strix]|uniref:Reverse transcriptase domain-containing protein n=1 Tax=Streblomastix strix TaxID=222440 RepID=A0A5J4WYJ1_9EUKA|nr:MAG: hypothetical protein EZS28_004288 [Streblomastix strix]
MKVEVPKQRIQQTNDHDTRSITGQLKSIPNKSLRSPEARANSDSPTLFAFQQDRRKKADVPIVIEEKFATRSKGNKTSAGSKNRNKDSTPKTRQKQNPITRLTSRISWTEEERDQEKGRAEILRTVKSSRRIEKYQTRMGGQIARETDEEAKEYKIMIEEDLKLNSAILIRKEQIKWYNTTFMKMKANWKWRKIPDAKALNQQIADFHFKKHISNEANQTIRLGDWSTQLDFSSAIHHLIVQIVSQPYLAFEYQNNHYPYRTMPFTIKYHPIYFTTVMELIIQQIRMKIEI